MKINIVKYEDGSAKVICPHCGSEIMMDNYNQEDTYGDVHFVFCENCESKNEPLKVGVTYTTKDLDEMSKCELYWDKDENLYERKYIEVCERCGRAYRGIFPQSEIIKDDYICNKCDSEF